MAEITRDDMIALCRQMAERKGVSDTELDALVEHWHGKTLDELGEKAIERVFVHLDNLEVV